MNIRAKFAVISVETFENGDSQVRLSPRYDESIPEDRRFSKATPSGELKMYINNPPVVEELKPGRQFYIDLTPID